MYTILYYETSGIKSSLIGIIIANYIIYYVLSLYNFIQFM